MRFFICFTQTCKTVLHDREHKNANNVRGPQIRTNATEIVFPVHFMNILNHFMSFYKYKIHFTSEDNIDTFPLTQMCSEQ